MIDIDIFLSTTLISRITTNPIRFFSQIQRAIISIYNMAVYTQGAYRNTVCTMVCCIPVTFVTLNDGEGGKYLACLLPGLYIKGLLRWSNSIGTHKASWIYLVALSCAEMISAVHVGSLGFNCSLASCSATNEENISIHYCQIRRNWQSDWAALVQKT